MRVASLSDDGLGCDEDAPVPSVSTRAMTVPFDTLSPRFSVISTT
jgi:hypothetical protein